MDRLNYDHLLYFWTVAKEGSVAAACRRLHLAQPTVSGQIRTLERSLGHKLLERRGRGLVLTEMGQAVFGFADDIFSIGLSLIDAVRGRAPEERLRLRVGVTDVLPKLVVYRILLPILSMPERVRLVCYEGKQPELLARLTVHELDVVLADTPVPPHMSAGVYSHRLGESGLSVFGTHGLTRKHRAGFPQSLDGAPFLLSTTNTVVRRTLDHWLKAQNLRPRIVGEFEDSALLKAFGQSGAGFFVAPSLIEREVRDQYGVSILGRVPGVKEHFYAISAERKIKHPAMVVLTDYARVKLSSTGG
ncbi:MAG: transcriptional activator NhaR [Phycisphaeraceae bacterium]|nr:transcriptional activator NhaR [Phycisphaerae bacterium]MBX3393400.1 transcriptional activator NhaR [Phycisphaeraceae bacterium]